MKQITIYNLLPLLKKGWVAMDAYGKWNWHYDLPTRYQGMFGNMLKRVEIYKAFNIALFDGSWKDSLINIEDYQKGTNKLADSKNENRLEKLEMLVDGKMADYPIGLKFFKRYGKEKRELQIEDVLKTYNSKGELVKTEYKAFDVFMGQKVYDYVPPATVFRGLKGKNK